MEFADVKKSMILQKGSFPEYPARSCTSENP
jgi:hypothetical protein